MPEPLLHLVFSTSDLSNLPARVGGEDRVVLMPGSRRVGLGLNWPCGVRVFCLTSPDESPLRHQGMIDYRELVALTEASSRVISW